MDTAFEKARAAYGTGAYDDATLEFLFPQLKESEDERVRKKVIEVLKLNIKEAESQMQASRGVNRTFEVYACNKVIAYLEKKSLNISAASEWLRKYVCNYMNSEYNEFHQCVEYDGSIDKERLISDFEEAMQKEQKPLSTEETELNSIAFLEQMGYTCIPPGKEQKPAEWSDEDEKILDELLDHCNTKNATWYNWLKSLRPQPHRRPSEDELLQLRCVISGCPYDIEPLVSLEEKLKQF